jgi:hypothetical protein
MVDKKYIGVFYAHAYIRRPYPGSRVAVLLWIAIVSATLLVAGFIYEKVQESRDRRRYPAPGRFVDVGGRRLHLFSQGDGPGPTVVIEQGMGSAGSGR